MGHGGTCCPGKQELVLAAEILKDESMLDEITECGPELALMLLSRSIPVSSVLKEHIARHFADHAQHLSELGDGVGDVQHLAELEDQAKKLLAQGFCASCL